MVYAVYATSTFENEVEGLSDFDKNNLQKIFLQLRDNPYSGDQIRYKFFREKRLREKRIYYLVYDDLHRVLIVAFGGKKEQQKVINNIIGSFDKFREYAERLAD